MRIPARVAGRVKLQSPELAAAIKVREIKYRGGVTAESSLPAPVVIMSMKTMIAVAVQDEVAMERPTPH